MVMQFKKNIKTYGKKDGYVWILEGLRNGELLINNPSKLLRNGQKVYVMDR